MSAYYLQNPTAAAASIPPSRPAHLSPRQIEVLHLLGEGLSNKQIARALGIADGTVKQHIQCVLEQFGAVNRLQAVIYAYRKGILPCVTEPSALAPIAS